jgi:hypothetical protein
MKSPSRRSKRNAMKSFPKLNEEGIASGHHFPLKKRTVSIDHTKNRWSVRKAYKMGSPFPTSPTKRAPISNDTSTLSFAIHYMT